MMTTSTDTRTVTVTDAQLRQVQTAIRRNGGFIMSSSPCATGYIITYTVYRSRQS